MHYNWLWFLIFILLQATSFAEQKVFVGEEAQWKYYALRNAPYSKWTQLEFDDSFWKSGKIPLGYGNRNENTVIKRERQTLAAYFRHKFILNEVLKEKVVFEISVDDGAVIYLNGKEVIRFNMPEGRISHTTKASGVIAGNQESRKVYFFIKKELFIKGKNVIAAQVHQNNHSSSDLKFFLRMTNFEKDLTADGAGKKKED